MEFGEIVVKDTPGLCRCCLSEGCYKDLGTEYPWMEDTEVYAHMLLECFDVSISQHMEGPNGPNRLICEVCITRLRDACNFKKQVLDSEKKFIDMVGRGAFKPKVLMYPEQMKSETYEVPVEEAEIEYLEEEVDYDDIPLNELAEPSVSEDITVASLPVATKRGRPKKTVKTEKKKKIDEKVKPKTSKGIMIEPDKNLLRTLLTEKQVATDKSLVPKKKESYALEEMRKNTVQILNNSTIMPFRWLWSCFRCFFCYEMFNTPVKLKCHQETHGKEDIQNALKNYCEPLVYVDVSLISCTICQTDLNDIFELIDHLVKEHKIIFNSDIGISMFPMKLNETPMCVFCDTDFITFNHLVTHMKKYHKECFNSYCSKCKYHFINYKDFCEHTSYRYIEENVKCCDCGIVINYGSLKKHMNDVHSKRYKCLKCFQYFPTHYKRSHHMAEMHNRDKFKCTHCSRTFIFQSILLRHIKDTHLKEKNAVCDICGWRSFSNRDLLSHMEKHTLGRPVKCKGCDKSFKCQRYMMRHYIKNHRA